MIKSSLKFVPKGPIDNKPAFFQVMACRLFGSKPLSEKVLTNAHPVEIIHGKHGHWGQGHPQEGKPWVDYDG